MSETTSAEKINHFACFSILNILKEHVGGQAIREGKKNKQQTPLPIYVLALWEIDTSTEKDVFSLNQLFSSSGFSIVNI